MIRYLIGALLAILLGATHLYAFDWGYKVKYLHLKEDCMNYRATMIGKQRYVCVPIKVTKKKPAPKKQKLPHIQEF